MLHNLQIQKILVKLNNVQSPYDRVKLVKDAIAIADAHNDIEWGLDLRKELIAEEKDTSSCVEGLPAFTWILETYEQNPDLCSESDFMLEYKWMVAAARRNANVSMEQFETIIEDYKVRLQRNGYSLHSYYSARTHMAFMLGKMDDAKEYLALRKNEKRDDLSFCIACEVHDLTEYEFFTGNIEKALTVGADLFSGKLDCKYIPFQTICDFVNILENDNKEKAVELFKMAETELERMQTIDMSNIGYVSELILYLTKTDIQKAWNYFAKYIEWTKNCEDYYNFQFCKNVLPLLKTEETRKLNINPDISWYNPKGEYNIKELYTYYYKQTETLATLFDNRNGNSNFTEMVKKFKQ